MGQKQKTEKREKRRKAKVGNNNGQLRIATPPRVAHSKPPGPILLSLCWTLSVWSKRSEPRKKTVRRKQDVFVTFPT